MADAVQEPRPVAAAAVALAGRRWQLALAAALLGVAAVLVPHHGVGLVLLSAAAVTGALAGLLALMPQRLRDAVAGLPVALAKMLERDPMPVVCTDAAGVVGYRNPAARLRFGSLAGEMTLSALLDADLGDDAAMLSRLQNLAAVQGAAQHDLPSRRGLMRLAVQRDGADHFLWRIADIAEPARPEGEDVPGLPMLAVSASDTVLYTNEALRRLLGGRVSRLDSVFEDLPLRPGGVHRIGAVHGPVEMRLTEIARPAGRRDLYLAPVEEDTTEPASAGRTLDALPVALVMLAQDGSVLQANRLARELLGHSMNGELRFGQLLTGLGRPVDEWLRDAIEGRTLRKPEVLRARRTAGEVYVQVTLERAPEGSEAALVAVLSDATELKTLEAQVVQSQKMQAIGQLAGGIAHDFNNLLTAISGHCDLLLLRRDTDDPDYSDLAQIAQNANRAAGLVSQLLAFSRKQTMLPETLDLRETLGELAHLLNRLVGERVRLVLEHAPDLQAVRADRRQIEQVMMNLVVNARDAMPEGGEIKIATSNVTFAEPLRRDRAELPPGGYVRLTVRDTGRGIPADLRDKVFEPFFTTKRPGEGTGLGLSTVYGIVKQSGGFIFADSHPDEGTEFAIFLPARAMPAAAERGTDAPGSMPGHGEGVVLLAEDEAPVRAFAARALRLRGYTVIEADSGEQALDLLADPALHVDVFVTDVIMPGRDGPGWVREALRARPAVRVIFVSGYAEDALDDGAARIPGAVFLPKPFSLGELAGAVQVQLAGAAG